MAIHFVINPSVTGTDFMKTLVENNRKKKLKLKLHNSRTTGLVELCKAFKKTKKHSFIIGAADPVDTLAVAYDTGFISKKHESDPVFRKFCKALFPSVTVLGEALMSDNAKTRQIAEEICGLSSSITEGRLINQLGSADELEALSDRLVLVYTGGDDLAAIRSTLGIPDSLELPAFSAPVPEMSDKAREGFTRFLADDYTVYNKCLEIKDRLNNGGN